MRPWKVVSTTLAVVMVVVIAAIAGVVLSGIYNVAATSHHLPVTYWLLNQGRTHSVSAHAASVKTPPLGGKKQLLLGAAHFNEMCSGCHMPPGGHQSEAAQGMYPSPPNLSLSGKEMPANQIFWIIKHGIKASGMPAWGVTHSDKKLWAVTALVKQFPDMTGAEYHRLVKTAHVHGIGEEEGESHGHHEHSEHAKRGSQPGFSRRPSNAPRETQSAAID